MKRSTDRSSVPKITKTSLASFRSRYLSRSGLPGRTRVRTDSKSGERIYEKREDYLSRGLTDREVRRRIEDGAVNKSASSRTRTTGQIIRAHTLTYFNLLNLLLGLLIFLTGQYKNMLFLGVIICNSGIGIFQELKVKSLIDKLSVITASRASVLRNGRTQTIPVEELVTDDIIFLRTGDQVVTDGTVLSATGLELNESMLTGESKPVRKEPGDPVLSGSFVTSGTGRMAAEKVGDACYAAQLTEKAQTRKRASSEMQRSIGRIIRAVSVLIIPVGLLLFRSQYQANENLPDAVVRTVSGIIGMIPEGLVLLTSVSFILGVGRLAKKRALVQEMEAIESLARIDILCTDKTGTITTGQLQVKKLLPAERLNEAALTQILRNLNGAFDDTNATQEALEAAYGREGGWESVEKIPFSSSRKFRACSFRNHGAYVLGAPSLLAPKDAHFRDMITEDLKAGRRVLLLGRIPRLSAETGSIGAVTPLAAVVLSDVIKEEAKETFRYFADQHVGIRVLSGDDPVTVSAVAAEAGIEGAERYVDASTLPDNPIQLAQEIEKYTIFGRVLPEQKQAFVAAWQRLGHTVAMVGDGVNDVLAIKDADCGIAMANGSEAARGAAHIVLMDSDFEAMKDIVREGKTIISNIERVSSLYLTKTIYSSLLCVLFILLQRVYPWTTLQMGLINMTGIGIPSFLLALEQNDEVTSGGFLRHVLKTALPSALTMTAVMLFVQVLSALFRWDAELSSMFSLILAGFVALLVVISVSWRLNRYRQAVLGLCAGIFLAAILFLPRFYEIRPVWTWWSLLLVPLLIGTLLLIYGMSRLTNRFMDRFYRKQAERQKRRGVF